MNVICNASKFASQPCTFVLLQTRLTRLPLEQVLCFERCDVGDGGEDVGCVGRSPLQAVPVVDLPVAGLRVHIELKRSSQLKGTTTHVSLPHKFHTPTYSSRSTQQHLGPIPSNTSQPPHALPPAIRTPNSGGNPSS